MSGDVLLTIDVPAAVRAVLANEGKALDGSIPAAELAFLAAGGYVYVVGPHLNGDVFARVKRKGCELVGVDAGNRS